jgi:hypothetical protein
MSDGEEEDIRKSKKTGRKGTPALKRKEQSNKTRKATRQEIVEEEDKESAEAPTKEKRYKVPFMMALDLESM